MRKIPTLFVRDEQDRRYVTDTVTPGCVPRDDIPATVRDLHRLYGYEGVVWHHPDGRMAKLKARDLRPGVT